MLIGLIEWQPVADSAYGATVVLIGRVVIIGITHGFICAPVVTRIAETRIAKSIGVNSVTSTYRFLERLGHIAGPIIVGQLFVFAGQTTMVVAWVGAAIVVLGLIFVLQIQPERRDVSEGLSS